MKTNFILAMALLAGAVTATQAQITPTGIQRGGVVEQTTVPPIDPATPVINPGTIDKRTPTTNSPTQSGVLGTIDQGTTKPQPKAAPGTRQQPTTTEAPPATQRSRTTQRKTTTTSTTPRP